MSADRATSRILALHGVAARIDPRRFAFRNRSSVDALDTFLSSSPRFVPLPDALAGRGDALTVDDTTRAAADAALLARRHGHAVSLFVNPGQVELGAPYAFVMLYALIDGLNSRPREFEGQVFAMSTTAHRQALHGAIKGKLRRIADERARRDLLKTLAAEWGMARLEVPPHFSTLSRQDLVALRDAGVDLQNHGWTHTEPAMLSAMESDREVRDGRAWLQRELDLDARYFAAPYGEALPLPGAAAACEVWFTLTGALARGRHSAGVFNRETPPVPEGTGLLRAMRHAGAWAWRFLPRA